MQTPTAPALIYSSTSSCFTTRDGWRVHCGTCGIIDRMTPATARDAPAIPCEPCRSGAAHAHPGHEPPLAQRGLLGRNVEGRAKMAQSSRVEPRPHQSAGSMAGRYSASRWRLCAPARSTAPAPASPPCRCPDGANMAVTCPSGDPDARRRHGLTTHDSARRSPRGVSRRFGSADLNPCWRQSPIPPCPCR